MSTDLPATTEQVGRVAVPPRQSSLSTLIRDAIVRGELHRAFGSISWCILFSLLVAGLWPFNPYPANEVSWLPNSPGLRFGGYGRIWASNPFPFTGSEGEVACSVEAWLQPAAEEDHNSFLAFYTPDVALGFELQQHLHHLLVVRNIPGQPVGSRSSRIGVAHIFQRNKPVFITITAGPRKTAVYLEGRLVNSSPGLGLTKKDLAGPLLFGTVPVKRAGWRGNLLGLAIYDQELTETQVVQNYHGWIQNGRPPSSAPADQAALYLFEERTGSVVQNSARWGPALTIPAYFKILQKPVLARPRMQDFVRWSTWEDVLLNVVGFIPLGFFVCAYLSSRRTRRAALAAILVGAAVSLAIELLQVYIPVRDSDMTDLLANTSGTLAGVLLYGRALAWTSRASLGWIRLA